ncbi:MAG: hypothetical protein M3Y87_17750 [Myxococcota bacterium]|nr:hypothetical protein [Myxococcota bacterium]
MRIGTMFLGRVEALENESVQTKFFVFGVPIAPVASYYATGETGNGVQGIEIPVHGTSVLAGYLRMGTFLVALLCGIFGWIEHRSYDPQYGLFGVTAIATIGWALSMFAIGRLSQSERTRRERLREATGIGAPPELLPDDVRGEIEAKLELRWAHVSDDTSGGRDWKTRLRGGQARRDELATLYALAEYSADPELVAIAARQIA